jgi:hypothetical protein
LNFQTEFPRYLLYFVVLAFFLLQTFSLLRCCMIKW